MPMPKITALQTLLAIKAITFAPHLNESERLVGCALIEHYNRTTGRCDPGGDRLAGLLFLANRTVIRATERLKEIDLFHIDRHGGRARCNSYEPQWDRLTSLELAWRERFAASALANATSLTPTACQPCHLSGDSGVYQTGSSNLQNETYSLGLGRKGFRSQSFAEAAREQAKRRLDDDLRTQLTANAYEQAVGAVDNQTWDEAIEVEIHRRGTGARLFIDRAALAVAHYQDQGGRR